MRVNSGVRSCKRSVKVGQMLKNDEIIPGGFHSAVVLGTARNASVNVAEDIKRIVDSLSTLLPTLAFIVESDSEDNTVSVLKELTVEDSRIRFATLGRVSDLIPDRIARLRHCRNVYLQELRLNQIYKHCDLVVIADLDGINTKINAQSLKLALESDAPWDVLTANQSAGYYDILALRHNYWSPNNWLLEAEWFALHVSKKEAIKHSMLDRMIKIHPSLPPFEVQSAFGGLALYRRWTLEKCDYSVDCPEAESEIDHVTLNRKIRQLDGRIFIHPGLINSNWTAHSLSLSKSIRFIRSLFKLFPLNYMQPTLRRFAKAFLGRL